MNIYSFLEKYAEELNQKHDSYEHWESWKHDFLSRTSQFKELIVNKYFTEINEMISKQNFEKAILLCKLFNTCYFEDSTEIAFLKLIIATKEALPEIKNKENLEMIFDLQYIILDFVFHEFLYAETGDKLKRELNEIKEFISLQENNESSSSLVIQKIEQINAA